VAAVAKQLRRQDPTDPTPYLLLRALRFGEVRAHAAALDPKLLEAPPSPTRSQLKRLLLDHAWPQLLEAAEQTMATPAGRGWLDLQRYVVLCCNELGAEYAGVARATIDELRGLLSAVPALLDATLMDDMPTATPETREWIRTGVMTDGGAGSSATGADSMAEDASDPVLARAMAEVRAGRINRAVEVLMRELQRETDRRGRFLRQTQLARILVEAELDLVAAPILEEMAQLVDTHRLEEWESGALVAQPLSLMYRSRARAGGDPGELQSLYLRICRLDPVQAIGLGQ
jgi:type VI secretion system protein ImpA